MTTLPIITLRHLVFDGNKYIGMQFYPNKLVQTFASTLDDLQWSEEHSMHYIVNTKDNFNTLFKLFKGKPGSIAANSSRTSPCIPIPFQYTSAISGNP